VNSAPAESEAVADAAMESAADAAAVAASESPDHASAVAAVASNVGATSAAEESLPTSELASAAQTGLPDLAMTDPGAPKLEEPDAQPAGAPADPSDDLFKPSQAAPSLTTAPAETEKVADAALASQADAAAVTGSEMVANSPLIESRPPDISASAPAESIPPTGTDPVEPGSLPELAMTDPGTPMLQEADAQPAGAPADPSQDLFNPSQSAPGLTTAPTKTETVADAALASQADAAAVTGGQLVAGSPVIESRPPDISASAPTDSIPPTGAAPLEPGSLPDLAMTDPGAPMLQEAEAKPAGAPADPSQDLFKPSQSAPSLATARAKNKKIKDAALASQADAAAVTGGQLVADSQAIDSRPPVVNSSATAESMPPTGAAPVELGSLPDVALVDAGAPKLEETGAKAGGGPANPAAELFAPGGAAAKVATSQAKVPGVADAAVAETVQPTAVDRGGTVASSAVAASRPPERPSGGQAENIPPSKVEAGLPELSLVDAGAPQLEEGSKPPGAPADTSKDQFTPGGSVPNLATAPSAGLPVTDKAAADPTGAAAVAEAKRDTGGNTAVAPANLAAAGALPNLDAAGVGPEIAASAAMDSLLPGTVGDDRALDPKGMASLVQKQRGKPGIDTIKEMGGSDGTEGAIGAAIEWLTKNQESDGRWDSRKHGANHNYDSGSTGLALLCFYGWGERHDQACKYQENVRKALEWVLREQDKNGYLGEGPGMMYSHAIATIALCEAYGVTKDPRLREPAERAIAFTIAAQSKTLGGWRYSPGQDSDTSVTGWQLMALHSARMAGLTVPEETFVLARGFLDKIGGGKHGGLYGYQQRGDLSRAMVATGMFCRQLDLVAPSDPMMQESARLIQQHPMKDSKPDLYYVYYATLALYQHQGPIWLEWNAQLKKILHAIQKKDGSWDPSSSMTGDGGRVVSTTLATLSLEVYYRLLPMYGFRNEEAEAPAPEKRGE